LEFQHLNPKKALVKEMSKNKSKDKDKGKDTASASNAGATNTPLTRKKLIDLLNEDLAREFQAIIAYVNYSQVLKGAAYMNIAAELAIHATEELAHAIIVANQRRSRRGSGGICSSGGLALMLRVAIMSPILETGY
jgi:hypothetical protein